MYFLDVFSRGEDNRIIYFFLYFDFCFHNSNFDFHKKKL